MLNFTLFGFPVAIHWMFWVIMAFLGGGLDAKTPDQFKELPVWIVAGFISIIVHELGHAFVMRRFGARPSIMLYGMGGLATANARWTRWQQIQVSLAGPLFGFALYFICNQVAKISMNDPWLARVFLADMIWINFAWSLINLLPILPLDGGRVLDAVLGGGRKVAVVGLVTAALVAAYFLIVWHSTYNALLFAMLAVQNFQRLQSNPAPYWPGMGR